MSKTRSLKAHCSYTDKLSINTLHKDQSLACISEIKPTLNYLMNRKWHRLDFPLLSRTENVHMLA